MYYPNAKLQWLSFYEGSPFLHKNTSILIAESIDLPSTIERYYLKEISRLGWQVIQYQKTSSKILVMAESPSRLLLTVIVENHHPTKIKLYIKPVSLY